MARSDYYIPVFDELPGHKKTRDLRKATDWNRFEVVGFLVLFWLQVAADFPDGELPGLDELEATLREIWSAAGFELKRKRIQVVAKALIDVGFVDPPDDSGKLVTHDWEDGAGMFALKRQYEREKKRRQRAAARQNAADDVPGTPDDCPPDVPGEKEKGKGKKETIPPNPPPAGGDFSHFKNLVMDEWRAACARVPVDAVDDNKTTQGAATLAKQLMAGTATMDQVRNGVARFLSLKYSESDGAKMASWGLNTLAKNLSAYQPKDGNAVAPSGNGTVIVSYECDTCGFRDSVIVPVGKVPHPRPCYNEIKRGQTCSGTLHPEDANV